MQPLLTTFHNPSNQTNSAFVFMAPNVTRSPALAGSASAEAGLEVVLEDFVTVLNHLRHGELALHAIHVAALWSAAGVIAAARDDTMFGTLPSRLRATFRPGPTSAALAGEGSIARLGRAPPSGR
jgi:TRAP-type mannitol/chloroaromatic compound transport system permease large subunit